MLSVDEVRLILKSARQPQIKAFLTTVYSCGLRLSEALNLTVDDIDLFELNEAFAAQACAVTQLLGLDPAKVNPNGGAVALGHPVGATGAILTVKAIYELQRTQKSLGLITMCIGGGQGIALAVRRL